MHFPSMYRLTQLRPNRRGVIIGSLVLLVGVGVSYALWSKGVWSDYEPSHTQWRQSIKAEVDQAVALPVKTAKEREAALSAHQGVIQRIATTHQIQCAVPAAVAWQMRFIESLQALEATCRASVRDVVQFKAAHEQVTTYLKDDVAIAKIITTIPQPTELADSHWSQQIETWNTMIQKTTDLTVSKPFESTKGALIARMSAIRSAWQKVIAASDARDKTAYMAAQSALAAAHDGLNELIMEDNADTLDALLKPLPGAYDKAFPRST